MCRKGFHFCMSLASTVFLCSRSLSSTYPVGSWVPLLSAEQLGTRAPRGQRPKTVVPWESWRTQVSRLPVLSRELALGSLRGVTRGVRARGRRGAQASHRARACGRLPLGFPGCVCVSSLAATREGRGRRRLREPESPERLQQRRVFVEES